MKRLIINSILILITLAGFALIALAQWTGSLNTNLERYYALNDTVGDAFDIAKGKNMTLVQPAGFPIVRNVPGGISGGHYNFSANSGGTSGARLNGTSPDTSCYDLNCSVSIWINWSTTGARTIYWQGNWTLSPSISLFVNNGQIGVNIRNVTGSSHTIQSNPNLDNGKWQHVVFISNTTTATLYVNNTLIGSIPVNSTVWANVDRVEYVGSGVSNTPGLTEDHYRGAIDEIGIWNRTLTTTEIVQLFNSGLGTSYQQGGDSTPGEVLVNLESPVGGIQTTAAAYVFNASIIPINANVTNATFYLWSAGNFTVVNSTVNRTLPQISGNNITTFNITSIPFGAFLWNVYGCGENVSGHAVCAFDGSNRSFERVQFAVSSQTYPTEIYETESSRFVTNLSLTGSTTLFSASLYYNGTYFLADTINELGGGEYQLIKTIDVPTVSINNTKNWLWSVTLDTGTGFVIQNTSSNSQTVADTNITHLDIGVESINYTLYDEETLVKIPTNATFDGTFVWYLGNGTQSENASYARASNNSFLFSTLPSFKNFNTDATMDIENSLDYNPRSFDFAGEILNGTRREQPLYLLRNVNGTEIIITVKDSGLSPLEDYLVTIERYYPSDNTHRMVEQKKTDLFGQITARIIENNVRYRVTFRNADNEVVKVSENQIFTCRSVICIAEYIIEGTDDDFGRFDELTNYNANLSFNNNTNKFIVTWNDNRKEGSIHRLLVTRYLINGTTTVCNQSSSSQISTISCSVGDTESSYQAQLFRRVGSREVRISALSATVGDDSKTFGREGLLWAFFLLFTLVTVGAYHPPTGLILYTVGFLLLGVLDIIYINPAIFIAELIVGVLFIWAFRS